MLQINHFPLRCDLQLARSRYQHNNTRGYSNFLRSAGFDVFVEAGEVVVYHPTRVEPDDKRRPVVREILSSTSPREQYSRGINAYIDHLLRHAGFVRVGHRARREYISPSQQVRELVIKSAATDLPSLKAHAHLRWTWELEWYEDGPWLVPLPGRSFLSAQAPSSPALRDWLRLRLGNSKNIKAIELNTGRHRTLSFRDDRWGVENRTGWEPIEGINWRVCLNMEALAELGYSVDAFHSAQLSFSTLITAVRLHSPFQSILRTTEPEQPNGGRSGIVGGKCLRFRKGTSRDLKDVHRLGVLEPPPRPVRLLVVASRKDSTGEDQAARAILNAHLADRSHLRGEKGEAALRSVGAMDGRDTIATIWATGNYRRGFDLPPFTLSKATLHRYDPETGDLATAIALEDEVDLARREGVTLIALVLLDNDMEKPEHDRLMRQFRGMKAFPLRASSLSGGNRAFATWVNLTQGFQGGLDKHCK
jgi:hypothetical protein